MAQVQGGQTNCYFSLYSFLFLLDTRERSVIGFSARLVVEFTSRVRRDVVFILYQKINHARFKIAKADLLTRASSTSSSSSSRFVYTHFLWFHPLSLLQNV